MRTDCFPESPVQVQGPLVLIFKVVVLVSKRIIHDFRARHLWLLLSLLVVGLFSKREVLFRTDLIFQLTGKGVLFE